MGPRPLRQHPYSLGLPPPLSNIENKEGFSWLLPRRAPKAPNLFPLPPPFSVLFLPPFPPSFDSNSFLLPRYPVCPDVCLLLLFPLPLFPSALLQAFFFGVRLLCIVLFRTVLLSSSRMAFPPKWKIQCLTWPHKTSSNLVPGPCLLSEAEGGRGGSKVLWEMLCDWKLTLPPSPSPSFSCV